MAQDAVAPLVIVAPARTTSVDAGEVYGPPASGDAQETISTSYGCPQSGDAEIVVCAPVVVVRDGRYRIENAPVAKPDIIQEAAQKIREIKIGPFELSPDARPADTIGIGARIRF
jgi:hypothetical protein